MDSGSGLKLHCPTCGGEAFLDDQTGEVVCPACSGSMHTEDVSRESNRQGLRSLKCCSCGAALMVGSSLSSVSCPYCGGTDMDSQDIVDEREPDGIAPFAVTRERAVQFYEHSLEGREYLPEDYMSASYIVSVCDAYVPYWLNNGLVDFYYQFFWSHTRGDKSRQGYECRTGTYEFEHLSTDGSACLSDDMGDTLEPFDLDELVPFSAEFVSDIVAERHAIPIEALAKRVEKGAEEAAYLAVRQTVELPSNYLVALDKSHVSVDIAYDESKLVLLPVWFIIVSYKGMEFLVGVNGQTGKVAANLPTDKEKEERFARGKAIKGGIGAFLITAVGTAIVYFMCGGNPAILSDKTGNHGLEIFLLVLCIILPFAVGAVWAFFKQKWARNAVASSMGNIAEGKKTDSSVKGKLTITKR